MQISKFKENKAPETRHTVHGKKRAAFFVLPLFLLLSLGVLGLYTRARLSAQVLPVSTAEEVMARSAYFVSNPDRTDSFPFAPDLSPWTWSGTEIEKLLAAGNLSALINARSAILVDATTGTVLFEKNADEPIPPASMTKLVAMYTAFHAAERLEISFDDVMEPPPESWASNIPPGSSLMFLGQGQRVTIRELLFGMAVASGNDAAIALALHISGSVPAFVERMNTEMKMLGLSRTRFVEPSGLSEYNMTTAREFADFALVYIRDYPEALRAFHSQQSFSYPMPWNLPPGSTERPVMQSATNRLLGSLEGCDGLKTGFINESGYNMSVTAERHGNRYISVTLGGPGAGSSEGNRLRVDDGKNLMEWAFANCITVKPEPVEPVSIPIWGGLQQSVRAIPVRMAAFTAPATFSAAGTAAVPAAGTAAVPAKLSGLERKLILQKTITAPVEAGQILGKVDFLIDGIIVHSVPLVADRSSARAGLLGQLLDRAARLAVPLLETKFTAAR